MKEKKEPVKNEPINDIILKIGDTSFFDQENSICLLIELFRKIRPGYYENYQEAERNLQLLIKVLKEDKYIRICFIRLFTEIFKTAEIIEIFTESGIEGDPAFFREFKQRIKHKILPAERPQGSLLHAIDQVFYKSTDHIWIKNVNKKLWFDFFSILGININHSDQFRLRLSQSLHIVSSRITALCAHQEIKRHLANGELELFIEQNRLSMELSNFEEHAPVIEEKYRIIEEDLRIALKKCEKTIIRIQTETIHAGTSLQQTYLLKKIKQLIYRMCAILDIGKHENATDLWQLVDLFYALVKNENTKNNLKILIRSNIHVLAYRISEHEKDTGEHYITNDRKDFLHMFYSAMGGGLIAGIVAVIKCVLHNIKMAPFWQGFAYSINYATGFVLIHVSGSTLATKQPAMTASAIASAMDGKNNDNSSSNMSSLAILISKVWRSQTASFAGNLLLAFPVALLLAFLWYLVTGSNIVNVHHAQELLDMQNPLRSNCLLYACNTGFFLYLSSVITGYFDNKIMYGKIPERLLTHPFLSRNFSKKTVDRLAAYVKKNLGPIIGNICLGFFLGMAAFFGEIFGLDFDIRHITISTGQFAVGLQGLAYHVELQDLLFTIVGILLIGFFNFLVSFTLAFFTAAIARGLKFSQYKHFLRYLKRLLMRYPMDFIFPPKKERMEKDLIVRRR